MNSLASRIERLTELLPDVRPPVDPDDLLKGLSPKMRAFVEDAARQKAAKCTRRAGKSYTAFLAAVRVCLKFPGVSAVVIGKTREAVRRIFWKPIAKKIDREHGLGCEFNNSLLEMKFKNGSEIFLTAADADEKQREKLFGQKFKLVVIDEAEAFETDLRELIEDVLGPALIDWEGDIIMCGMPCNRTFGYFFDVTTRAVDPETKQVKFPNWSVHEWSALENPFIAERFQRETERLRRERPGIERTAGYRQMYLGEWVVDTTKLVYVHTEQNIFDELPKFKVGSWHFQLSVDLGYEDECAFVVSAYHDYSPTLWILEAYKQAHMDITAVAVKIRELEGRYDFQGAHVIDGSNKQAVMEMSARHNLALLPADKREKREHIAIMNDDLVQARVRVHRTKGQPLLLEWTKLIKKFRPDGSWEEDPGYPNHAADAALYGWRWTYPYLAEQAPDPDDLAHSVKDLTEEQRKFLKKGQPQTDRTEEDVQFDRAALQRMIERQDIERAERDAIRNEFGPLEPLFDPFGGY